MKRDNGMLCWITMVGLTTVFVSLKLTGVISWSWTWVLAPTWLPWALVAFTAITAFPVLVILYAYKELREWLKDG